ncbi:glycoside hydrolase family 15 protein [Pseudoruegeria sp. SK021]|uniref:glycoside hydrolase family 15 protein n=1 Tax=Pseudoruegeria sp. SK021 TaxID=1933035 RepID=UPI000A24BB10|nr:glycoside hydrolase family 15 protein [Pseudoruegeria sp. SK021]OSP55955.1 hypothetical protein BV911_04720 [Pseudoruegeria sp. SK021]
MAAGLAPWITARRDGAIRSLRGAVSATHLERHRQGFGWTVRPVPGSILASPRMSAWDPEPDYFHHWIRDAAIVIRVWPDILADLPEAEHDWWVQAFHDHVTFSLAISDPARPAPKTNPLAATTRADHRQFLRPEAELRLLSGAAWLNETRFAPDGSPDSERWSAPQFDGPALRASAIMAVTAALPALSSPNADRLIARDLAHVLAHAGQPCIGPWEEPPARRHSYTLIAQWDALDRGAMWSAAHGDAALAARCTAAAKRLITLMEGAADPLQDAWIESLEGAPGQVDAATVLAILQAGRGDGPFALTAPRTRGTAAALAQQCASLYPINRGRAVPAIGRWAEDAFFGGNPWYPVTLGFAELYYRIAAQTGDTAAFAKAEGWMDLIREVAPSGDALPEQFDRSSGAPTSSLELSWSAAAFIAAAAARDAACARCQDSSALDRPSP